MKIKLAILEKDTSYLKRIIAVFNTKYSDKFEIYSFTDENVAYTTLNTSKIDVFVANDIFEIDTRKIPKRCGFAYLVDSVDVESYNNQRAICKYQKVDLIYKQILSIYIPLINRYLKMKENTMLLFLQRIELLTMPLVM